METPELKNYNDHLFVQKIVTDYAWFHKHSGSEPLKESYCLKVYAALNRVKNILVTLQHSRVMLAEINIISDENYHSTLSKATVKRYHIEVYFLRLTTYKDLVIQLIAAVNQWIIPGNNGAGAKLGKLASAVGKTYVAPLLTTLDNMLSTAKPIRNLIAHEGSTSDPDVLMPELFHDLKAFIETLPSSISREGIDLPDDNIFAVYESLATAKSINDMMENEEHMATYLFKLLDTLLPEYRLAIPENHPLI
jgi:hypothetical protein